MIPLLIEGHTLLAEQAPEIAMLLETAGNTIDNMAGMLDRQQDLIEQFTK